MGDHIEEIAFLGSVLTQIAARIEALKLRSGTEALRAEMQRLQQELQRQKDNEVTE